MRFRVSRSKIALITTFLKLASMFLFIVLFLRILFLYFYLFIYLFLEIIQHDSGTKALGILDIILGLIY